MRLVVRTSAPRTLTSNYRYNIAEYAGGMGVAQKHHATTAMQDRDLSKGVIPTQWGPQRSHTSSSRPDLPALLRRGSLKNREPASKLPPPGGIRSHRPTPSCDRAPQPSLEECMPSALGPTPIEPGHTSREW